MIEYQVATILRMRAKSIHLGSQNFDRPWPSCSAILISGNSKLI
jgi:hypothetical protein